MSSQTIAVVVVVVVVVDSTWPTLGVSEKKDIYILSVLTDGNAEGRNCRKKLRAKLKRRNPCQKKTFFFLQFLKSSQEERATILSETF